MIFIRKRIQDILDLKKERHFLPGVLLGGYAIVILASVMSIWSFIVLGHLDNPFFNGLLPIASLFFPFYVAMIIIFFYVLQLLNELSVFYVCLFGEQITCIVLFKLETKTECSALAE